jgi:hypothetical protein
MRTFIFILLLFYILLSCQRQEKKALDQKADLDLAISIQDQLVKKTEDFFRYQDGLADTTLSEYMTAIIFSTRDPYGTTADKDTFISISLLYCNKYYEFDRAFLINGKEVVIVDSLNLSRSLISTIEIFYVSPDSIPCVTSNVQTVFTYIIEMGEMKEWIFPFNKLDRSTKLTKTKHEVHAP